MVEVVVEEVEEVVVEVVVVEEVVEVAAYVAMSASSQHTVPGRAAAYTRAVLLCSCGECSSACLAAVLLEALSANGTASSKCYSDDPFRLCAVYVLADCRAARTRAQRLHNANLLWDGTQVMQRECGVLMACRVGAVHRSW